MSITAIARNFDGNPNIVTIVSDNTLAEITTTGYLASADIVADIELLQNGEFQWTETDLVLIYYSPAQIGFFTHDATNETFDALAPSGGLSNTLQSAHIFVGSGANVATDRAMTGDISINNTGVTAIAADVIVNADVNSAAAIDFSKLAALASGNVLVGSAGNVATSVPMTGDVVISNTGVTAISAGVIVNADINSGAAIAFSKLAALPSGQILVGSAGTVPTAVAMSGDATIVASGALTIAANAITTAKILNANVTLAKLAAGITPAAVIKFFGQATTVGGAAAEAFVVTGAVAATDRAFVQMVDNGTGNVTVLQAVVTTDTLTVTFSGDPGNDAVINYQLIRAAA
tara:strand:+ start:23627 stop:24667 length:1041 start_codon:yes stop_codon:yes gene_type:complete